MSRPALFTSIAAALMLGLCGLQPDRAEARVQYNKAFKAMYGEHFGDDVTLKCNVCHGNGGKNKKVNNEYSTEIKTVLEEKNVKDDAKIKAAFEKVAEMKSDVEGKTYGDLLREGILPKAAE